MAPRSLTILALLATLSACAPDPSNPGATPAQIEDSAGVRIVTYAGTPTSAASFRFAAEPRYRHGTNPGDYAFQGAGTGRLLPDGGAIVYDEWNAELVVIEADSATHEVLAVEGEGPGDVGHIDALFALGQDSILMADPDLGRITLFAGRAVARTWALTSMRYLRVKGIASPDDLLLATSWGPTGFAEAWAPGHLARFDMETSALDTVASFDLMAPFPPELEWDPIEPSGEVTVASGHFVQTRSDMAQVTWRLADGTVTQIVRWRAAPAPLTAESLEPIAAEHRKRDSHARPRPFRSHHRRSHRAEHDRLSRQHRAAAAPLWLPVPGRRGKGLAALPQACG